MTVLHLILSAAFLSGLQAQTTVAVRDGNVHATRDGQARQITSAGLDVEATVSHDGQRIAFVRRSAGAPDELRIAGFAGEPEKVLVTAFGVKRPTGSFFTKPLSALRFSPDDVYIHLLEDKVLYRVEVVTGVRKALMGNVHRFAVIETGLNRGRLVLSLRSKCFIEDLRHECHPVLLGTPAPAVNWKLIAKDDENFEDLLEQYSR